MNLVVPDENLTIELSVAELREITGYAVACAEFALPIFERDRTHDPRVRESCAEAWTCRCDSGRPSVDRWVASIRSRFSPVTGTMLTAGFPDNRPRRPLDVDDRNTSHSITRRHMTARIRTITFDCKQWEPLVAFWSQVGDYAENPDNPNNPGDPEGLLTSPTTGISLLFLPVPESKTVKNRVHLDLTPTDRTRDEEVARLIDLGATLYADHRKEDGTGFVVLADPEGNEFCVERSEAERAAASRQD